MYTRCEGHFLTIELTKTGKQAKQMNQGKIGERREKLPYPAFPWFASTHASDFHAAELYLQFKHNFLFSENTLS